MKKCLVVVLISVLLLSCVPAMANSEAAVTIMNCDTGRLITDQNGNTEFYRIEDGGKTGFTDAEGNYLNLSGGTAQVSANSIAYTITSLSMQRSLIQLPNMNYVCDSDEGTTNAATIASDSEGNLIRCAWFITPVENGRPLRILCLGDSLTYGVDLDLSGTTNPRIAYRQTLSMNMIDYFGAVAFVGNVDEYTTTVSDPFLYRHSGYSGYVIEDVYHVAQHPGIKPMVDDMMAKYQPDIVIMMLGTNDLGLSIMTGDIIPRWESLVRQIEKQLPENGMILCASLPPLLDSTKEPMFNEKMQARLRELANEGIKIGFADPNTPLSENEQGYLNSDGVHFNSRGYQVIGTVFTDAITTAYNSSGKKIMPNPLIPADPYAELTEESSQPNTDAGHWDINPVALALIGIGVAIVAAVIVLLCVLKKK